MNKSRGLALGIVGLLILIGGVALSVLTHVALRSLADGYQEPNSYQKLIDYGSTDDDQNNWRDVIDYADGPAWTVGLSYIIPGIIMLVAALVQHKAGYIISAILGLLALIVLGIFVVVAGILLIALVASIGNVKEECQDTLFGCKCENNYAPFKECHYITDFVGYSIGMMVCFIISWILLLVASILAIVYSCRNNVRQPGMVYSHLQEQVVMNVQNQSQAYHAPYGQPAYAQGGPMPYFDGPANQEQFPKGPAPAQA